MSQTVNIKDTLKALSIEKNNPGTSTGNTWFSSHNIIASFSPVDGGQIGAVSETTPEQYEHVLSTATEAFKTWRIMPAPQRGDIVRQFGDRLRDLKEPLGKLVSYEMGKRNRRG